MVVVFLLSLTLNVRSFGRRRTEDSSIEVQDLTELRSRVWILGSGVWGIFAASHLDSMETRKPLVHI